MAYAALLSLAQILHQTLNRDYQYLILDEKKQIESLVEEVTFLQNRFSSQKITRDLKERIRDAAYAAEDVIESHMIDRFLTESAGHEVGSKEKILIRFDIIETKIVNSITSARSFLSTGMGSESSELEIAGVGGIEKPRTFQIINGIRKLAKTRRFKAWFLDLLLLLDKEREPHRSDIWSIERLATYGTKMVIICDSPLPASTIMEELRIHGFDTSLFVGAITSEDLRKDDAWLEKLGPSYNYTTRYGPYMFKGQGSISPGMYKSAMVMAGVDAADCIAVGENLPDIKGANAAGISSVFVTPCTPPTVCDLAAEYEACPTYLLRSFTW